MRFALIISVAILEHVAYETVLSFNTTRDFLRYRVRYILRETLRHRLRRLLARFRWT